MDRKAEQVSCSSFGRCVSSNHTTAVQKLSTLGTYVQKFSILRTQSSVEYHFLKIPRSPHKTIILVRDIDHSDRITCGKAKFLTQEKTAVTAEVFCENDDWKSKCAAEGYNSSR